MIIKILVENQILDVELTSPDANDENISSIELDLVAGVAEDEVDKEIDAIPINAISYSVSWYHKKYMRIIF